MSGLSGWVVLRRAAFIALGIWLAVDADSAVWLVVLGWATALTSAAALALDVTRAGAKP